MKQIMETSKYINKQDIIITNKSINEFIYNRKNEVKSKNKKSRGQDL